MCERVRMADAAKELGVSPQAVREHMKKKLWNLGDVLSPKQTGKSQWEYHIYRAKLDKHLGKDGRDNAQALQ